MEGDPSWSWGRSPEKAEARSPQGAATAPPRCLRHRGWKKETNHGRIEGAKGVSGNKARKKNHGRAPRDVFAGHAVAYKGGVKDSGKDLKPRASVKNERHLGDDMTSRDARLPLDSPGHHRNKADKDSAINIRSNDFAR